MKRWKSRRDASPPPPNIKFPVPDESMPMVHGHPSGDGRYGIGGAGIFLRNGRDVSIEGIEAIGNSVGIYVAEAANIRIKDVKTGQRNPLTQGENTGICIVGGTNGRITNGVFTNCDVGVKIIGSTKTELVNMRSQVEGHMTGKETKNVVVKNSQDTKVTRPTAIGLHTNVEVDGSVNTTVEDAVAMSLEAHRLSLQLEGYIAQLQPLSGQPHVPELLAKLGELVDVLKREGRHSPIVQYLANGATTVLLSIISDHADQIYLNLQHALAKLMN